MLGLSAFLKTLLATLGWGCVLSALCALLAARIRTQACLSAPEMDCRFVILVKSLASQAAKDLGLVAAGLHSLSRQWRLSIPPAHWGEALQSSENQSRRLFLEGLGGQAVLV